MKLLAGLCATLVLVSCADSPPHAMGVGGSIFVPSAVVSAQLSPLALPFNPLLSPFCPIVPAFTTAFDLVVDGGRNQLFLDRVLLHLNDGLNVGGPMVTFPRAELTRLFGPTVILGSRRFAFNPTFGCGAFVPRSIVADLDLIDAGGVIRTATVTGKFR